MPIDIRPDGGFEHAAFLFTCDNRNRGILRMNFDEAALLWRAACAGAGAVLEIGRRRGGSTVLLAMATRDRRIVSLDIAPEHHPIADALFATPPLMERLELLIANSHEPLPDRVFGFALIDGDHSFPAVLRDTLAHWPSITGQAPLLCAFHDALPNAGLQSTPDGLRDVEQAATAHVDNPQLTNHFVGVEAVCDELVASGVAREWDRAGSMRVLEKLGELPADFAERATRRMESWKEQALGSAR